jgi:superfamily II DNA/RNA helicase
MEFKDFNLDERLLEGIDVMGFEKPTPVQEQAIPLILQGKDIIASAQTGTGKTAAFVLPLVHKIINSEQGGNVKALVIVPTRELAMQIDQQLEGMSYFTPISSIAIYGGTDGTSYVKEKQALKEGADIVICTPGRILSHLYNKYVQVSGLKYLVLDEADRMLDMGFYEDIMKIISYLPEQRQSLFFSATMPEKARKLAHQVLTDPVEVNIARSKPVEKVLQVAYVLYENQKIPMLKYLLQGKELRSVLIFCSTKVGAKELNKELKAGGLNIDEIHSDLTQSSRENVLRRFKNRSLNILVATDILSRGIDIEDIDLVVNYDVPNDDEDYIHRIGRTARAEAEGVAITLISPKEQGKFHSIEKLLGNPVMKLRLPASLGEGPEYDPGKRMAGRVPRHSRASRQRGDGRRKGR